MNINVGTAVISYFSEISGTSSASNFQNKKLKYFLNKFIVYNYKFLTIYHNNIFIYNHIYK